jgi:hypothetical protein
VSLSSSDNMNEDEADNILERLSKIVGLNPWLSSISPVNLSQEREEVMTNNSHNPNFVYVDNLIDDAGIFRQLVDIQSNAPDTVYGNLQKDVATELRVRLESMLGRGSDEFQDLTEALCGRPIKQDTEWADTFYDIVPEEEPSDITPERFRDEFCSYIKSCNLRPYSIEISPDRAGIIIIMEDRKIILPKRNRKNSELRGLKIHEIGTHAVQYENAREQDKKMFMYGFPGFVSTVEGLALYNENTVGALSQYKMKMMAGMIKAIVMAEEHSFADIYNELLTAEFSEADAFRCAYESKRGFLNTSKPGANFNRNDYISGMRMVEAHLNEIVSDQELLYSGRISLNCIDEIRGMAKPITYRPNFIID